MEISLTCFGGQWHLVRSIRPVTRSKWPSNLFGKGYNLQLPQRLLEGKQGILNFWETTCEEEGNFCTPFWLSCLSQQLFKTSNQHQKVSILNGWKNHTNLHTKLTMGLRVYLVTPENHQVKYFSSPSQAPGSWGSVGILISLGQCSNKKLQSVFGKTNSSYLGLFSVVETFWMNLISKLRDRT